MQQKQNKDLIFGIAIKHKCATKSLPVFCATPNYCVVVQSIPENNAIKALMSIAKQIGLPVKEYPAVRTFASVPEVRSTLADCRRIAATHGITNYFIVSNEASITSNNGSPIIRRLRDALIAWESLNGGDPDEDWATK